MRAGAIAALMTGFCALIGAAGRAEARTATYVAPASIAPGPLAALSTKGDKAGYVVGLDQTLALVFDQRFGGIKGSDKITVFTLAPSQGDARAIVSFGVYNNGSPIIVRAHSVNAGSSLTISNLFQLGCAIFQGCNYISITTDRARKGAAGTTIDYIDVNGEVTDVTAPTPEPSVWALMIVGFVAVAWRLKTARPARSPQVSSG